MAIWQVSLHLVNDNGQICYFDSDFQKSLQLLEITLPEEKSWCPSIKQFGKIDSTCLEIDCSSDGHIEEFSLRIDLRNITKPQVDIICEFANQNNLVIQHKNQTFECTTESISHILRQSEGMAFVKNPVQFLQHVKSNNEHT